MAIQAFDLEDRSERYKLKASGDVALWYAGLNDRVAIQLETPQKVLYAS